MTEWIGMLAGLLTTACFVPQVLQVVRSRDTKSISLLMYVMYSVGVALWIFFGVLIGSLSVIICNVVTLMLALIILAMKIRLG